MTSEIAAKDVQLSDCQPEFCSDGRVRWYVSNGTATKFYSIDPFRFADEERVMLGDVNLDGVVDITDATYVQMASAELVTLTDRQRAAADMNGDGVIDVNDATYIQMQAAR